MKISGHNTLAAPVDKVWAALLDPKVLARCIPGCESLTPTGPHSHIMRVTAGVAAIKGTYDGSVALVDLVEPTSLTMKARGAGAPGTIEAAVAVTLAPSADGGTELTYDADASVGGAIGGVGQRMLAGVTKKMAGQFFQALDADIAGERPAPDAVAIDAPIGGGVAMPAGSPIGGGAVVGQTYAGQTDAGRTDAGRTDAGRATTANAPFSLDGTAGFALGTLLGGALVAVGVLVGSRLGRRG